MTRPLAGVHFVEDLAPQTPLAVRLAVSLAGRIAADLGATVSRLDGPDGDPLRTMAPMVHGASALYAFLNAGKTLVPHGEAAAAARRSATVCLRARTDAAAPSADVIDVQLSLLGWTAPADTPASEFTVLALSGTLNLVGDPEREPLRIGGHQAAYAAGLSAFTAAMGALCKRGGERVRVSLLECAVWLNWKDVVNVDGGAQPPSRAGRAGHWPVLRCKDGWVALVYQEADWPVLCALAGNDPRLLDPGLAQPLQRRQRAREIAEVFEDAWRDKTRAELEQAFMAAKIPAGAVWSPAELAADAHYLSRGFLHALQLDAGGRVATFPRLPVVWGGKTFTAGAFPAPAGQSA